MESKLTLSDEQLLDDWLRRAADAELQPLSYKDALIPPGCDNCGKTKFVTNSTSGDVVCDGCGALMYGGRAVSADDGAAHAGHRREQDMDDEAKADRATDAEHDRRRSAHQSYQRCYHFNERIAARQNNEPRIPPNVLELFDFATRFVLGMDATQKYRLDQLSPELLQQVCRAFKPLHRLDTHAERWLQLRYYLVTGRRDRVFKDGQEVEHSEWDIKWMRDQEIKTMQWLFKQLAQCFDELYYRPSSRYTTKDLRVVRSRHQDARHNILQLNYLIQQITLIMLGRDRFDELRTEFCFRTNRGARAKMRLDRMMSSMVSRLNKKNGNQAEYCIDFTPL